METEMKVFLSWSGPRSKAVAELLNDWLRCVLQACKPWISSRDIDRGALWFSEITNQLSGTDIGIVCLTADNKNKPWILFEAGALAKGLSHARVCTILVDLQPSEIEDPLAQFNHTLPEKESMWSLVRTLNDSLQNQLIDERILSNVFSTYWPQFEENFKKIISTIALEEEPKQRTEKSLLDEILENTRGLSSRVRQIEARIESGARMENINPTEKFLWINQGGLLADYEEENESVISKLNKEQPGRGFDRLRVFNDQLSAASRAANRKK